MSADFLKNTWVTSDWHVGHNSVLSFCKGSRGHFMDLEHMHKTLVTNYNNMVKPHQTCYFLGDFAFKGVEYGARVLSQLNGHKVLIRGNHDKGHQSLLNMGFAAVLDSASFYVFNYLITMSHFPLAGIKREKCENFATYQEGEGWHGEFKYKNTFQVLQDTGQDIHLHGHVHSPNNGHSERILGKQFDVGVDANDLRPISLRYIINTMKRERIL